MKEKQCRSLAWLEADSLEVVLLVAAEEESAQICGVMWRVSRVRAPPVSLLTSASSS